MTLRGRRGVAELLFLQSLLLTIKGELRLTGQPEPVVGLVGQQCVLSCRLQPAESVADKSVEWTRADLDPTYVLIYRQRRLEPKEVNPSFKERTELFEQGPEKGDMSLKLNYPKLSDTGTYTCKLVMDVSSQFSLEVPVVIGAVSEPQITLERSLDKLVFKCEVRNWYPKPEMEWRDSKEQIVPHEDISPVQDDEYFSIVSRITVEMWASDNYTCTVRQLGIRETRKTNFTVPEIYKKYVSLEIHLTNIVAVSSVVVVLLLVVFVYWAWRKRGRRTDVTDGAGMPLRESQQSEITRLGQQVELKESEITRLGQQVELKESEITRLGQQVELKESEITRLGQQVELKESEITRLRQQVEPLRHESCSKVSADSEA
ncbi:butyrophilin subfamily 1 member A1-like [Labrus bergylta]|uniref:butyrophilin subfamily 1 member A1-like n=1 Tax=Labrus bergylta TaxID=56723 RepID=UPI00331337E4